MQGYQALLAWREAAGQEFEIHQLVDVLRSCNMEDVVEVAISLMNSKSFIFYRLITSAWRYCDPLCLLVCSIICVCCVN